MDELAGGDFDVVGGGGGGGDLEASEEGAVTVVAEAGEDARADAAWDRVGVLGGDHGQAELPGEGSGGGGRVELDLSGAEASGEEGGEVEGSAGAHGVRTSGRRSRSALWADTVSEVCARSRPSRGRHVAARTCAVPSALRR